MTHLTRSSSSLRFDWDHTLTERNVRETQTNGLFKKYTLNIHLIKNLSQTKDGWLFLRRKYSSGSTVYSRFEYF